MTFDWGLLRLEHMDKAHEILGVLREPDLCIAPDGSAYLWRWHVIPRNHQANVYFHVQVADDPERPLHDHPWDNTSVLLAGGYDELLPEMTDGVWSLEDTQHPRTRKAREGAVIHRRAEEPHRLLLAADYTMTLFTTGPWRRHWGFWFKDGWRDQRDVIENLPDGRSIFKDPTCKT